MTTDHIDTAKERDKLTTIKESVMLMCEGCWEESNCHPADEMLIANNGKLYCDVCMDQGGDPSPWTAAPDPESIALRALSALDAARAENERLREALLFYADSGKYPAPLTGGQGDLYFDCGQIARAALNPEGEE